MVLGRAARQGGAAGRRGRRGTAFALMLVSITVVPGLVTASSQAASLASASATYPVGVYDSNEPSGLAPPASSQLAGYSRAYVSDFTAQLRQGLWDRFSGVPKGDTAGRFAPSHVEVAHGMLRLGAWRDATFKHHWVTGGACLCGLPQTYGAYFVRSRETAAGPDDVELLWPANNQWPPELDFDEMGQSAWSSSWTDHYLTSTQQVQETTHVNVRHWHTWGVVWTPTAVTFVVDGRVWGSVTAPSEIPTLPMTLDLQQQTWCGLQPQCPTRPSSMLIDWVAVFSPT